MKIILNRTLFYQHTFHNIFIKNIHNRVRLHVHNLTKQEKKTVEQFVQSRAQESEDYISIRKHFAEIMSSHYLPYCDEYIAIYKKKLEDIKAVKDPKGASIIKKKVAWYDSSTDRLQWDKYKEYLINKDFPVSAITDIDISTDTIITSCNNPKGKAIPAKGLTVAINVVQKIGNQMQIHMDDYFK